MKIEIPQATGKTQIMITRLFETRYEQTRLALLHEVRKPRSELPASSEEAVALVLLLSRLDGEASIATRLSQLSTAYFRIHKWIVNASSQDLQKVGRELEGGEIPAMTFVVESGLGDTLSEGVITAEDVVEICRMAVLGAGFEQSQETVVSMLVRLANTSLPALQSLRGQTDVSAALPDMIEVSIMIRLFEIGRWMLASPVRPAAAVIFPKTEAAVTMRAASTLKIAAKLAFIELAAASLLRQHISRIVQNPWFMDQAHGKLHDSVQRAIKEYASKQIDYPAFERWPEFDMDNVFEARMIPGWPATPPDPITELPLPSTAYGDPFAGSVTIKTGVSRSLVAHLTDVFWELIERTQAAAAKWKEAAADQSHVPKFNVVAIAIDDFSAKPATVPRQSATLPLVSAGIPRMAWYEDTNNWRLIERPMNPWHFYTYADAVNRISIQSEISMIPCILTGSASPLDMKGFPAILPFFEIFDAPATSIPKNLKTIALLWGLVASELQEYFRALRGSADSTSLRLIAESLRFVGIVTVRQKVVAATKDGNGDKQGVNPADVGIVVEPIERTWYHTRAWWKFTDLKTEPILLAERADARMGSATVSAQLLLWPFTHVPSSADPTEIIGDTLQLLPLHHQVANKPIVTYAVNDKRVRPIIPIIGWKTIAEEVADIALIRTMPRKGTKVPIYVDSASTMQPQKAFYFNAAIRISDPTPSAPIGTHMPIPMRYESTGSDTGTTNTEEIEP